MNQHASTNGLAQWVILLSVAFTMFAACSTGLPVTDVMSSPVDYDTAAQMAEASEVVMVATVTTVEDLGVLKVDQDPEPSEWAVLTFTPEEVLLGTDPGTVTLIWETFVTDGAGNRRFQLTYNGVPTPEVGDRYLLFLKPERPNRAEAFGNRTTHMLTAPFAIMAMDANTVSTEYAGGAAAGVELNGYSIEEVKALFADSQ